MSAETFKKTSSPWFHTEHFPTQEVNIPLNQVFPLADAGLSHRLRHVMRMGKGAEITLVDSVSAKAYRASLWNLYREGLDITLLEALPQFSLNANAPKITAMVALIKGQRWDGLLQKLAELGVSAIQPLACQHSVVEIKGNIASKRERWTDILKQACEQSEQVNLPRLLDPGPVQQVLQGLESNPEQIRYLASERGGKPLHESLDNQKKEMVYAIGPEGGWSDAEHAAFLAAGFIPVSLGTTILRSETAGIVMAGVLQIMASPVC